jgi:hypothetical protein
LLAARRPIHIEFDESMRLEAELANGWSCTSRASSHRTCDRRLRQRRGTEDFLGLVLQVRVDAIDCALRLRSVALDPDGWLVASPKSVTQTKQWKNRKRPASRTTIYRRRIASLESIGLLTGAG